MTEVLDFLYSSSVWMTVIIIVVMFVCVGLSFTNPFKNKKLNYAYKTFLYAFAFCFMMSFQFLYYGYTDEFRSMYIGKTTICLYEEYERGGEGPSENVTRIHIIDRNTGLRKARFYNGSYGELVGIRNDTLCYLKGDDVVLFDAAQLKEIYTIKRDSWGTVLSDLNVGLEHVSGNNGRNEGTSTYVVLDCKNGKTYWFDPFSKKITEKEPKDQPNPVFSAKEYELAIIDKPGSQRYFLDDAYAKDKLKRIVAGEYGKKFFKSVDSTTYIEPFFLCIDTLKEVFVFGHYTTTDREEFYLEAKDFDFKTKWKKISSEFAADSYNEPKINVWQYIDDVLYFNNGGFIIAIHPETSKVIWLTRL